MSVDSSRGDEVGTGPKEAEQAADLAWPERVVGGLAGALGTVAGIAPHVLHHIGPIAGAAILTGTEGSVLFGVIGFGLTIPLLLRLKKRFQSWVASAVALFLFAVMFTVSTLWIGPAIRGDDGSNGATPAEDPHHSKTSRHGPAAMTATLYSLDKSDARLGAALALRERLTPS